MVRTTEETADTWRSEERTVEEDSEKEYLDLCERHEIEFVRRDQAKWDFSALVLQVPFSILMMELTVISVLAGGKVTSAGIIVVKHGLIKSLNPLSGHYRSSIDVSWSQSSPKSGKIHAFGKGF